MAGESADVRARRLAAGISLAAVLAFVLLITLPFVRQPIHIDDAIFWDFATRNLDHPFQQHMEDYSLMGQTFGVWRDTHPPLDQLYMTFIMKATGSQSEQTLHLGFIIFPIITGISMFFLARRFVRNSLLAVLLLLATPAFMTMSHTLMGDGPLIALWLAATAAYIYGVDRNDQKLLGLSGVISLLAVFAGYQALALVLLLPLYSVLMGRHSIKTLWPVSLPLLGFGAYCLHSLIQYDALPRFKHSGGLSLEGSHLLERFQGSLLHLGGASVFPLLLAGIFSLRKRRYLALLIILAFATALGFYYFSSGRFPPGVAALFVVFLTAGAIAVLAVLGDTSHELVKLIRRRQADRERIFLGLWLLGMLTVVFFLLPHATARYILPFLFPLVLLLFKEMEQTVPARRIMQVGIAAFVLTFTMGTVVSAADYQLAGANRDFAQNFAELYEVNGTVWFVGEWGFRHYMEKEGYRYLTSDDETPRQGDLVVRAEFSDWQLAAPVRNRLTLVETRGMESRFPVRLMNFRFSAGFYGTHWGYLPYVITSEPVERYEVFTVTN